MAHFAELSPNGTVLRVVVVDNRDTADETGREVESIGVGFLGELLGPNRRWVQCSYNANFRGCYPGPGYTYDPAADVFLPPAVDDNPAPVD